MLIYESKDRRILASQIKHKIYNLQIKEMCGRLYYEAIIDLTYLVDYLEAEKKIRALGAKAKKLDNDMAIQIFLAQASKIQG